MSEPLATVMPIRPDRTIFGPFCAYCGDPATVIDHVHARSDGGPNDTTNLVDACGPCNSSKSSTPVAEWLARILMKPPSRLNERTRQIVERLKSGEIADRLGPPRPGWDAPVRGEDDDDVVNRLTYDDLAACVAQSAYQDLWSAIVEARLHSNRLLDVLGDEWVEYRDHLWGPDLA